MECKNSANMILKCSGADPDSFVKKGRIRSDLQNSKSLQNKSFYLNIVSCNKIIISILLNLISKEKVKGDLYYVEISLDLYFSHHSDPQQMQNCFVLFYPPLTRVYFVLF